MLQAEADRGRPKCRKPWDIQRRTGARGWYGIEYSSDTKGYEMIRHSQRHGRDIATDKSGICSHDVTQISPGTRGWYHWAYRPDPSCWRHHRDILRPPVVYLRSPLRSYRIYLTSYTTSMCPARPWCACRHNLRHSGTRSRNK